MTSPRKVRANRRNAERSTGPRDTARSRLNAVQHGILSNESLIRVGEGKEDEGAFESFRRELHQGLAPVGALEELLADHLVMTVWRWRRVLRYETASIREKSDAASYDWEQRQVELSLLALTDGGWQTAQELADAVEKTKLDIAALAKRRPLETRPALAARVPEFAERRLELDIDDLLGLTISWTDLDRLSDDQLQGIIDAICEQEGTDEPGLWQMIKAEAEVELADLERKIERRKLALNRLPMLSALPDDHHLEKVQRYEAHLSRQFYRALRELQRLQALRLGEPSLVRPSVELIVDADQLGNGH